MKALLKAHEEWIKDFQSVNRTHPDLYEMASDMAYCSQCGCFGEACECKHPPLDRTCGLDVSGKCYCCERYNQINKQEHETNSR